ncbi:hypothetical protein BV25DRAFT_1826448 [Artomyces pyxidatus]|uniref:Uncharacterized protein n=1 Tax=Artomyces pyxidatus TaxID=48021 RepID=A0ACB8SZ98_9AGAM|nr:hypothetical protein BV25DRAFT_1826448 [Artomyces pyxidatus]
MSSLDFQNAVPMSVDPKLDHTNFSLWKFKTQTILEARGLYDIVDGSETSPTEPLGSRMWRIRDACARLQIIHNIPDSWLWLVSQARTAAACWAALHAHFHQPTSFRATSALGQFHAARLEEGGDVAAHIQRMGTLWQDVLSADACPDGNRDAYFAGQLLASLPASYNVFVATWRKQMGESSVASATVIGRLLDVDAWHKAHREERAATNAGRMRRSRSAKVSSGDAARRVSLVSDDGTGVPRGKAL